MEKNMLKVKRSLVLALIIAMISATGTSVAKAEVVSFVSAGNEIYVEQGQPVTLENLTGQTCTTTCIWSVLDFTSGIQWSADANGAMTGTAAALGGHDVELRGLATELVADSFVTTATYTSSFRIYVVQGQTIAFDPVVGTSFAPGTSVSVRATSSTGLPVSYASLTPAVCSVNSASGLVSLIGEGRCRVEASRAADLSWIDAASTINIESVAAQNGQMGGASVGGGVTAADNEMPQQMSQTITFADISDQLLSTGTITAIATASSLLPVTFAATGTCTVNATTGVITFTSEGTCTITASQAGYGHDDNDNDNDKDKDKDEKNDDVYFEAAADVVKSFSIRRDQIITLNNPGAQYFVANSTFSAAVASFNPVLPARDVTYVSTTTGVCTVNPTSGLVTVLAIGSCSITGTQAGTAFLTADTDTVVFVISNKLTQTISFPNPGETRLGVNPFYLAPTAVPSGLQVSYLSNTPNVCTVRNSAVTILTTGTCSITASQPGNGTYSAAQSVTQPFAVIFGTTNTINVSQQGNKVLPVTPFNLNAAATSGLTVTYVSANTAVCTVSAEGLVTVVGAGTCAITLSQAGNGSYPAAFDVLVSFEVTAAVPTLPQTITVTNPADRAFVLNQTVQLDGAASSPLTVVYSSNSDAICTVSSLGVITIKAVGTCSIAVNQPGNATYFPAPGKIVEFMVNSVERVAEPEPTPVPTPAVFVAPPVVVRVAPVVTLDGLVTTYNGRAFSIEPQAGAARCSVTYNGVRNAPRDAGTYAVVAICTQDGLQTTATSSLVIKKAKPSVDWFDPASITTTTKLTRTQLNARASVLGAFAYESASGTTLPEGVQPLRAVFTPRDTRNFESVDVAVNIVVTRKKLQTIVIPFDMGSSNLSRATRSIVAQIKDSGASAITILGYVKPSRSLRNDQVLSLARANEVRAAVLELLPEMRVSVQALDRQRNPLCDFTENKCAVITE